MKRLAVGLPVVLAVALIAPPALAQNHLGSYRAWIGQQDLYGDDGQRLGQAAQVLRQDRANLHFFGRADPEDSDDPWFDDSEARLALEQALMRGGIDRLSAAMIQQGGVWVQVDVYGWGSLIQAATATAYR